jgi:hypothetical protein
VTAPTRVFTGDGGESIDIVTTDGTDFRFASGGVHPASDPRAAAEHVPMSPTPQVTGSDEAYGPGSPRGSQKPPPLPTRRKRND